MKFFRALAFSVTLAGCGMSATQISSEIANVQSIALQVCKVIPAADAVSAIILSGNAALATAGEIATAICAAVSASGQATPAAMSKRGVVLYSGEVSRKSHWTPTPVNVGGQNVGFL